MSICKDTISIVGSGISGITCALKLANSDTCRDKVIRVYERQARVGGRANAIQVKDCFIDLGAGRFSSQLHKNVFNKVKALNIGYESFPFTKLKHQLPLHSELKAILQNLKLMSSEHKGDSFLTFLTIYVGEKKAKEIINALGYDSLLLSNISPQIAYDIIEKHPEIQSFSENAGYAWYNLTEGFSSMVDKLYQEALNKGVEFFFEHELVEINHDSGVGEIVFCTKDQERVVVDSGEMIITFPPSAMGNLQCSFPQSWTKYTYGSVPLFKGFMFYDSPWWERLKLSDHVVITSNKLRKIYFKDDKYIFFYTDGDCAEYWGDVAAQGEAFYLETVKSLLAEALGCHESDIPTPAIQNHKFWDTGVEFSLECCPEHPNFLTHQYSQIISTSDAYTAHCGWMEGGIIAGESAAQEVLRRITTEQLATHAANITSPDNGTVCLQTT